ncbi:MAG: mucin-binding protein, partial [Lactobacillus amylovorus]
MNYVDQNGNELAPSTTQKITFSRELKHDLV